MLGRKRKITKEKEEKERMNANIDSWHEHDHIVSSVIHPLSCPIHGKKQISNEIERIKVQMENDNLLSLDPSRIQALSICLSVCLATKRSITVSLRNQKGLE